MKQVLRRPSAHEIGRRVVVLASATLAWMCLGASAGAQVRPCQPASALTSSLVDIATRLATDTGTGAVKLRTRLGITVGAPVALVRNDSLCDAVTTATQTPTVTRATQTFAIVAIGASVQIYLAAPITDYGLGATAVLNGQLAVIAGLGAMDAMDTSAPANASPFNSAAWALSASSTWSLANIHDAIDGNPATRWTSGAGVQVGATYFVVDMNTTQTVVVHSRNYPPTDSVHCDRCSSACCMRDSPVYDTAVMS